MHLVALHSYDRCIWTSNRHVIRVALYCVVLDSHSMPMIDWLAIAVVIEIVTMPVDLRQSMDHICVVDRVINGAALQIHYHPPSKMNQSHPRTSQSIYAATNSYVLHSTVNLISGFVIVCILFVCLFLIAFGCSCCWLNSVWNWAFICLWAFYRHPFACLHIYLGQICLIPQWLSATNNSISCYLIPVVPICFGLFECISFLYTKIKQYTKNTNGHFIS